MTAPGLGDLANADGGATYFDLSNRDWGVSLTVGAPHATVRFEELPIGVGSCRGVATAVTAENG